MTTLADVMRRWREDGVAPFPTPLLNDGEARRQMQLEEAEMRVRNLCAVILSDPQPLLDAAPPYRGTTHRAEVLTEAARLLSAGYDYGKIVRILEAGYGPDALCMALAMHMQEREMARERPVMQLYA